MELRGSRYIRLGVLIELTPDEMSEYIWQLSFGTDDEQTYARVVQNLPPVTFKFIT